MKNKIEEACKEIAADLLDEINNWPSNRPKGVGITSRKYIENQLILMLDLLKGYDRFDEVEPANRFGFSINYENEKSHQINIKEV